MEFYRVQLLQIRQLLLRTVDSSTSNNKRRCSSFASCVIRWPRVFFQNKHHIIDIFVQTQGTLQLLILPWRSIAWRENTDFSTRLFCECTRCRVEEEEKAAAKASAARPA